MNKLLLVIPVMFLLVMAFSSAGTIEDNLYGNATHLIYPSVNTSQSNDTNFKEAKEVSGNVFFSTTSKQTGTASLHFPDIDSRVNYTGNPTANLTFTFFSNISDVSSGSYWVYSSEGAVASYAAKFEFAGSEFFSCVQGAVEVNWAVPAATVANPFWKQFGCSFNKTGTNVYIDVIFNGTVVASTNGAWVSTEKDSAMFGNLKNANAGIRAGMDSITVINRTISGDELTYLYERGKNGSEILGPTTVVAVEIPTFSNSKRNATIVFQNDVVGFNITIKTTDSNTVAGYIFANDNGTGGQFYNSSFIEFANFPTVANATFNTTVLNLSGITWRWKWFANSSTGDWGESSIFSLIVSGVGPPNVTLNRNNFFTADNSTVINLDQSKAARLNFTLVDDLDVFGFELVITDRNGVISFNLTNNTMNGTVNLTTTFSGVFDVSNFSDIEGVYFVNLTTWDSHTAASISNYKVDTGKDYLIFDDTIRITAEKAQSSLATKKTDKYIFKFTYSKLFTPTTKTFYIESDNILTQRLGSGYKAHFVDFAAKKWIDFDGIPGEPVITKISDYKYKIEYLNSNDVVEFSSIGGLNSQEFHFEYYLINPSVEFHVPKTDPTFFINNSIFVSLNVTSDFRNVTRFRLYDINNLLIATANVTNIGTGTYFYNTTFTDLSGSLFRLNATHVSTANTTTNSTTITFSDASFNVTIRDEITRTLILERVTLEIIGEDFAQNHSTVNGTIGITGWTEGEVRLTYDSAKYTKRDFYFTLANASNFSVDVYLLSINNGTDVTFTAQDNSGNDLEGALIRLKRFYVETNSYITVAMIKTNSEGQGIIDVDFNDAFYETLTTFEGKTLRTIGAKIISTTLILTMDLLPDPFTTVDTIEGITTSLSFTNSTQTFVYVFTDIGGTPRTGQIDVIKRGVVSDTTVCTNSDTSVSATILCQVNTTSEPGNYLALGLITVGSNQIRTDSLERENGIRGDFQNTFGTQGAFVTMIIAGTLAGLGAGISPAVAIIMFLAGLGVVNFIGFSMWSLTIYVSFVIVGVILIFKMKK